MKFLKLTVVSAEGEKTDYNLTEADAELDREKVLSSIGDALFGNEAIFAGSTELTVNYENEDYVLKRAFTSGQECRLFLDGKSIPAPQAREIIAKIAVLSDKKWRLNAAPVDVDEFVSDPVKYTEQYLASLGFDRDELEKRIEKKENLRDFAAGQAEAIKSLSEEYDEEDLSSALEEFEEADKNLNSAIDASKDRAWEIVRAEKKKEAEAKLAELKKDEDKIDDLIASLEENEENKDAVDSYEELMRISTEYDKVDEELKPLNDEIAGLEAKIKKLSSTIKENAESIEEYTETLESLNEDFAETITENAETGELTAAALEKATGKKYDKLIEEIAEFENWNKKYSETLAKLSKTRLDYETRSSVRTGMALETALQERNERLNALKKLLNDRRKYVEELETELNDSRELYESKDAARIVKADEKRMKLLRYKILCHTLQVDISSAEQKIRTNVETKQSYAEDITALTRAKNAINEYVSKLESRNAKLSDKLISLKARLAFCKDVDALEYGALCPICNGRITDKVELSKENARLSASYEKYNGELVKNRSILAEYSAKLEKIDTRLGQLKERDALCNSYVDSLGVTVGAKQTALTGILKESGATSVPALEKTCDAANMDFARLSNAGIDGAFVLEHIKFLEKEIKRMKSYIADLNADVAALERDVAETDEAHTAMVVAHLNGRSAYDILDEIVETEKTEDALHVELANIEKNRGAHLAFVLETEKSATEFIVAATEILSESVTEIKEVEDSLRAVTEETNALTAELTAAKEALKAKNARLNELGVLEEKIVTAQDEIYSNADIILENEEAAQELKLKLMTERQIADATEEIEAYETAKAALKAEIATLSEKSEVDLAALPDPKEAKEAYDEALKALLAAREKQAFNLATKKATEDKLALSAEYGERALLLKKLIDGKIAEIILPIINDVFELTGGNCIASADENNGLAFTKDKGTPINNLNGDRLTVAVNAALNHVLKLATDLDTIKFATVEKSEDVEAAASKYGILFI